MTKFSSNDDRDFIDFIKKNKPLIPQEKENFEEELIKLVHQENCSESKPVEHLVWIFPSLVLFGVLLVINSEQPNSYQFAIDGSTKDSSVTNNNKELEAFVINSWKNTIYSDYPTEKMFQKKSDLSLSAVK